MGKKGKSKTRTRNAVKDLTPKDSKHVKGGHRDFVITKVVDKSSPTLAP
jgi:type VI protein secretion system component Hcp